MQYYKIKEQRLIGEDDMLIKDKLKKLTNITIVQKQIIEFMLNEQYNLKQLTMIQIAHRTYTSPAALSRLAKKMGFNGFVEFKTAYLEELEYLDSQKDSIDANIPFKGNDNIMTILNKIAQLEEESIKDTVQFMKHDELRKAVNILRDSQIIHLCGVSFNCFLGKNFALKMSRIGKRVEVCDIPNEFLYTKPLIQKGDVAIVISYSGGHEIIHQMIDMYEKMGIPIIGITAYGQSYLRDHATVTLTVSTKEKMYSKIAGYSNETSIKFILDTLYSCYFALNYDYHFKTKKELSRYIESDKKTDISVIEEND